MILGIPKEIMKDEKRVAALPENVAAYVKMGFKVIVEASAGEGALRDDAEYVKAGASIAKDAAELFSQADVVIKVKQPGPNSATNKHEVDMLKKGAILVTFLHPAAPGNHDMIRRLRDSGATSFTMDGIPRTSRAQTMDALTSMSTVTGYKSVIMAASHLPKFLPMIGTAIGSIKPATVLVVGAGVVGLQAVATAKRLGAVVKAMDIRAEAAESAKSLGAKIEAFDVPREIAAGEGGYAKPLPKDWLEKERAVLAPAVASADIVILSALVPSEEAPVLVTAEMVAKMARGSVIVDVSIDQGGNCALTKPGEISRTSGVVICGLQNIPGSMPVHSSWLYANNMVHFIQNLFKKGLKEPDWDDDIARSALVTRNREIRHQGALRAMETSKEKGR